jgi:hypothetical protein
MLDLTPYFCPILHRFSWLSSDDRAGYLRRLFEFQSAQQTGTGGMFLGCLTQLDAKLSHTQSVDTIRTVSLPLLLGAFLEEVHNHRDINVRVSSSLTS